MNRWIWLAICSLLGIGLLICGLLVPIYLRAVDASVLQLAGRNSPTLVERGLEMVGEKKLGPAQLLVAAARQQRVVRREQLDDALLNLSRHNPRLQLLGSPEPRLEGLFGTDAKPAYTVSEPFTDFLVRQENRDKALKLLAVSARPVAQELMRTRSLTNTVIFPPSYSSSGQAFDAAIALSGLLDEEKHLSAGLSNAVISFAAAANRNPQPFEQLLLDLLSLGQRFNWAQLIVLLNKVEDPETLRLLANLVRKAEPPLVPELFAAVQLSGRPGAVVKYLMTYSKTGLRDLGMSLRYGSGGVNELLRRNQPLHYSRFSRQLALDYSLHLPWFALTLKWLCYLAGGFLLAAGLHYARRPVSALERPLQVRGFHFAREFLFALGFLLVVLLLSEPFLAQESQKVQLPFRLRLPMAGNAAPAEATRAPTSSFMNQMSLLTLLLFFVLQSLIYTACLVKLAEIRRQHVPSRIKLKLLENEDHLFDAGLYLGFVGTIISLILVSLGVIQPSLMAAYSSTSFGIIFVSVFKIFNLRPVRRKLLLEAEAASPEAVSPASSRAYASPS